MGIDGELSRWKAAQRNRRGKFECNTRSDWGSKIQPESRRQKEKQESQLLRLRHYPPFAELFGDTVKSTIRYTAGLVITSGLVNYPARGNLVIP